MELQHILVKGVTCRCKISCERRLIVFVLRIMIYLFVDTTRKPDYYAAPDASVRRTPQVLLNVGEEFQTVLGVLCKDSGRSHADANEEECGDVCDNVRVARGREWGEGSKKSPKYVQEYPCPT